MGERSASICRGGEIAFQRSLTISLELEIFGKHGPGLNLAGEPGQVSTTCHTIHSAQCTHVISLASVACRVPCRLFNIAMHSALALGPGARLCFACSYYRRVIFI